MSVDYFKPTSEINELVKKIRKKYYPKFRKAKIVILMRTGKWDKYGTLGLVSKKQKRAGVDGDYILTLNADEWNHLGKKGQTALVDHELRHMARQKTKNGTKFRLYHHDVEEFIDIVKRYGPWRESLVQMKDAMKGK
jgi:hypothetical protein